MSLNETMDAFSYEEDSHLYRNSAGTVRPSVTQILTEAGVFDYSQVDPLVLGRKRKIGHHIHLLTAEYDRTGAVDQEELSEEEAGYFEAWLRFRKESKFVISSIAKPMLRTIMGVEVGGRPDRTGFLGSTEYVLDLKTCTAKHPGWALQLALYEMLLTGIPRCGRMGRIAVQLMPDGNYRSYSMEVASDAGAAISALMLSAWKQNNGIRSTASERKARYASAN